MKRPISRRFLLSGMCWAVLATLGAAQEPVEKLQFVQNLRARGYTDFALQYLEKVKDDADVAPAYLRERARTRLSLAMQQPLEKRAFLFDQVLDDLRNHSATVSSVEAAELRVDAALVWVARARTLLSEVLRLPPEKNPLARMPAVRHAYRKALRELRAAATRIEAERAAIAFEGQTEPASVESALLRAKYELAVALVGQAQTYDSSAEAENLQRATDLDAASRLFESVWRNADTVEIALPARAWLVYCGAEFQEPYMVLRHFEAVRSVGSIDAREAQRLARCFLLPHRYEYDSRFFKQRGTRHQVLQRIQQEALAWLKAYPMAHDTPEAHAVRLELASALLQEAIVNPKSPDGPLLARARRVFEELAQTENDCKEKARRQLVWLKKFEKGQ